MTEGTRSSSVVPTLERPSALRVEDAGDSIAIITFEGVGDAPFVIGEAVLEALSEAIDLIGAERDVRGVLFRGASPEVFCAGADVDAMARVNARAEAERLVRSGQELFERISRLRHPTVALIDGTCVGGGLELALACRARVATPGTRTRLGLPETRLGIIPAWGGSTRLPRLVGMTQALSMITSGKTIDARRAQRIGLVDVVAEREHLVRAGAGLVRQLIVGEPPKRPRRRPSQVLFDSPPLVGLTTRIAGKKVRKATRGRFPAPERAVDLLASTRGMTVPEALEAERSAVLDLLETPVHRNLLRLFRITRDSQRPDVYRSGKDAPPSREIAVIGGGTMGAGIAALAVGKGLGVRLIDPSEAALVAARKRVQAEIARRRKRRDVTRGRARTMAARFSVSTEIDGLAGVDCVIEAVPERRDLKRTVLTRVAEQIRDDAIIATNTSSLPVSDLATDVRDAARFCGLHFFNPPTRMPLLEIIRGEATSDATIARGLACAKALGKTPIVVDDGPGFLVNRLLAPYFLEACRIADEGPSFAEIDAAIRTFGFPMGPFRLMDEVGLDVIADASRQAAARAGGAHGAHVDDFQLHPTIAALVDEQRLGRKTRHGFHRYDGRGRQRPRDRGPGDPAVARRLVGRMVAEARRLLGDGLVLSSEDVDIGTVFGIGFPPDRGGLLHWAESEEASS